MSVHGNKMPNLTARERTVQAANLLNQQIWCWGRDIDHADGNLLVRFGFQRIEKPGGSEAASIYRLELSATARIVLRGFGVFCGADDLGGLFVRRYGFQPQRTPEADLFEPVWSAQDLPPLAKSHPDGSSKKLLLTLVDWVRQYEIWIADSVGLAYRHESLVPWDTKHGTVIPAGSMATAWGTLGADVAEHPEDYLPRNGS